MTTTTKVFRATWVSFVKGRSRMKTGRRRNLLSYAKTVLTGLPELALRIWAHTAQDKTPGNSLCTQWYRDAPEHKVADPHKCPICGICFAQLETHLTTTHAVTEENFKCTVDALMAASGCSKRRMLGRGISRTIMVAQYQSHFIVIIRVPNVDHSRKNISFKPVWGGSIKRYDSLKSSRIRLKVSIHRALRLKENTRTKRNQLLSTHYQRTMPDSEALVTPCLQDPSRELTVILWILADIFRPSSSFSLCPFSHQIRKGGLLRIQCFSRISYSVVCSKRLHHFRRTKNKLIQIDRFAKCQEWRQIVCKRSSNFHDFVSEVSRISVPMFPFSQQYVRTRSINWISGSLVTSLPR